MTGKTFSEAVDDYLRTLTVRKRSPKTVDSYGRDLSKLVSFADGKAPAGVTSNDIRRYLAQMHASGMSPVSIARTLSAWRGFFSYLCTQKTVPANPADGVKGPKKPKPLPHALSVDEAVRLVTEEDETADETRAACDKALFELMYASALRVSEIASLDVSRTATKTYTSAGWIDMTENELTVTGKGSKTRTVPFGEHAAAALSAWLSVREKLVKADNAEADANALFLNSRGRRLSPRLIQQRIREHAKKAGVAVPVHPHMMRHSAATHMLQSSGDLRAVQEMLGHASLASTQVYTSLDFQALALVYDSAHPKAKLKKDPP